MREEKNHMGKYVYIAEKPSVAREFAKALKEDFKNGDGFMESDSSIVTWCVGHLVTMSYPEVYDPALRSWKLETLPFLPKEYKYEVIENVKKQFDTVKKLLQIDFESTVARCRILQGAKLYRENIAVAVLDTEQDRVVAAQAADELVNISGVQASIVVYATNEGGVIISARSVGDINVQVLLEKLGGGGNKSAAGAQLADTSLRDGVNMLFKAIDDYLA